MIDFNPNYWDKTILCKGINTFYRTKSFHVKTPNFKKVFLSWIWINTNWVFTKLGKEYQVCGHDGVHPGPNGHLVIAYAFLKAMGLDGKIGTINVDMNGATTSTAGHKILSASSGIISIESTRYPFCFIDTRSRSILPFIPFNQDLNRYTLIVSNLPTETAEIKWGEVSKIFTKEQLEAGINLAAEFLDNPFSKQSKAGS